MLAPPKLPARAEIALACGPTEVSLQLWHRTVEQIQSEGTWLERDPFADLRAGAAGLTWKACLSIVPPQAPDRCRAAATALTRSTTARPATSVVRPLARISPTDAISVTAAKAMAPNANVQVI